MIKVRKVNQQFDACRQGVDMVDLVLQAMLHNALGGKALQPKAKTSRYQDEIARQLKIAVDEEIAGKPSDENSLLPPQALRAQIEEKLKASIEFPELSQQLQFAFEIVKREKKCVDGTAYAMMVGDFARASTHLDSVDMDKIYEQDLQTLFKISDATMDTLQTIAVSQYDKGLFTESLAIYTLLSTLAPMHSGYWYYEGIAAQKCEKYELALKAYAVACFLNPSCVGARVFAAECYLVLGEPQDAKLEFVEAKKILEFPSPDEDLRQEMEMLKNLEVLLAS